MDKFKKGDIVRHHKTDNTYLILRAPADNCTTNDPPQPAYEYRRTNNPEYPNTFYKRDAFEMEDGRFSLVSLHQQP